MESEPRAVNEASSRSWWNENSIVRWLRDAPWLTQRRLVVYPRLFLAVYAAASLVWILSSTGLVDPAGHPLGADFMTPWAASRLALNQAPAAAYDMTRLWAAERAAVGYPSVGYAGFYYPPMYLLIVLPLAMLPYVWSLAVWTVATLSAYLAVLWKIDPDRDSLWLAIAFPGALVNLTDGQNGFLTLALLGSALLLLERRPILSGVTFGLMSYKPQFGLLVPLFLLATGRWRALGAAAITVALLAALSYAIFGADTWQAFFASIAFTRHVVLERGGIGFEKLQSSFASARLWGFGVATSYAVQAAVSLMTATVAIWVWVRSSDCRLQAAALATGTLLMSPYMMDYDLVVLALPIAWLGMQGRRIGFMPWEKSLLVLAWLLPLFARSLAGIAKIPIASLVTFLLLVAIARRVASTPSDRLAL